MERLNEVQLASLALRHGTKPADILALLENLERWERLGIIDAWAREQLGRDLKG